MQTNLETKRKHQRISVAVPATVTAQGHTLAASTKDVSLGGLFLFTDAPFQPGADIQVVLMLPRELGLPASEMVCCHGKVIRVEITGGHYGIAASIERMSNVDQV